jgi:hypothetical protein
MARERIEEEKRRQENKVRRNVPRNVAPRKMNRGVGSGREGVRLESHLTIGRPVEIVPPVKLGSFREDFDEKCAVEQIVQFPEKVTSRQEQSMLFKLPLEIRRQIYAEAIGKYKIHISFNQTYRKMDHQRCKHPTSDDCFKRQCISLHKQKGARDAYGQTDLLALLKTCRMV